MTNKSYTKTREDMIWIQSELTKPSKRNRYTNKASVNPPYINSCASPPLHMPVYTYVFREKMISLSSSLCGSNPHMNSET